MLGNFMLCRIIAFVENYSGTPVQVLATLGPEGVQYSEKFEKKIVHHKMIFMAVFRVRYTECSL